MSNIFRIKIFLLLFLYSNFSIAFFDELFSGVTTTYVKAYPDGYYENIFEANNQLGNLSYSGFVSHVNKAINKLEPGSQDYYFAGRYIAHANALSMAAGTELLLGEPGIARDRYYEIINVLNTGLIKHKEVISKLEKEAKETAEMMVFVSSITNLAGGNKYSSAVSNVLSTFAQGYASIAGKYSAQEMKKLLSDDVKGDYFRMPVMQTGGGIDNIVQLHNPSGRCTAFIVDFRVLVTNAHCVVDDNLNEYPPSKLYTTLYTLNFWRMFTTGKPVKTKVLKIYKSPDYKGTGDYQNDWAVLIVDRLPNVPSNQEAPEIPRDADKRMAEFYKHQNILHAGLLNDVEVSNAKIAIAGYSGDINSGTILMVDHGCPIVNYSKTSGVSYKCSSFPGNSGGPIYYFKEAAEMKDRRYSIIGVHACGRRYEGDQRTFTSRDKLYGCGAPAINFIPAVEEAVEYVRRNYL